MLVDQKEQKYVKRYYSKCCRNIWINKTRLLHTHLGANSSAGRDWRGWTTSTASR